MNEPLACVIDGKLYFWKNKPVVHDCHLYEKKWVGLTDEDLRGCDAEEVKFIRYWEKKLQEKNA